MKSLLLAALVLVAACSRPDKEAKTNSSWTPRFGRIAEVMEVVDDASDERIGFVEKTVYDDGRTIYWVKGLDREENRGFILPTGRAYKYEWYAGERSAEPVDLGADVRSVGARRILGYDRLVRLEPTTLDKLAEEIGPKDEPAPKNEASEDE